MSVFDPNLTFDRRPAGSAYPRRQKSYREWRPIPPLQYLRGLLGAGKRTRSWRL